MGFCQKLSLLIQYTFSPLTVITSSLESKNIAGPGRPGRPRRPFGPISPSVPFCPLAVETKDNTSLVPRRSSYFAVHRKPGKEWTGARVLYQCSRMTSPLTIDSRLSCILSHFAVWMGLSKSRVPGEYSSGDVTVHHRLQTLLRPEA